MDYVKKLIDKRALHKMEYDSRQWDRITKAGYKQQIRTTKTYKTIWESEPYLRKSQWLRTQSLVAEKTDILENRASRNFDLMINIMTFVHISSGLVLHRNDVCSHQFRPRPGFFIKYFDHNRSELRIHDHSNDPSSSKLVPKVVPLAVKTATSRQELELLFHHHIAMLRITCKYY
ncbi:hypothetical protein Tco_1045758 [Tanacetum coccineum]|uniref:Uncharacterized protein n=1 Tax=Tanacetum coccineum TaxID=301880 RepID=A0ABQ5GTQ5_9ASTR